MSDSVYPIKSPKKLIEVALPLDAINKESSREKFIRHGHPSTLHPWWARRPLATARAIIFAQMVNDPGWKWEMERREPSPHEKGVATKKRQKLFKIIEQLVVWENSNNADILKQAYQEIVDSWRETCELNKDHPNAAELFNPDKLPAFHDPFAGGGILPLEAQRLGLESNASDLNPIPVMINRAIIEVPSIFSGRKPVHPVSVDWTKVKKNRYCGAEGLAEDIEYYGGWMREEAYKRIGHLFPKIEVSEEEIARRPLLKKYRGRKLTVIAWIWARTVKSPNPAFSEVDVPLASTFVLSKKKDHEAYVEPIIDGSNYSFLVKDGKAPKNAENGTALGKRKAFFCLLSKSPIDYDYIRSYGRSSGLGVKPMAIVAEGDNGRVYLSPSDAMLKSLECTPEWAPEVSIPTENSRDFRTPMYGLSSYGDLFTKRQLVALNTFSDLILEAKEKIKKDALACGYTSDEVPLSSRGNGAEAYSQALSLYLSFAVDKSADYWSSICSWHNSGEKMRNTFGHQAIPMTWDYTECNPFCSSTGNWMAMVDWVWKCVAELPKSVKAGFACQADAQTQEISQNKVVSTDPPYYDNMEYAELSDFFYVWMRHNMKEYFPQLFATIVTPKAEELVASPYRHGSEEKAEKFFLDGMTLAMKHLCDSAHGAFPVTIYYAFKQSESTDDGLNNTGWETFLQAVIDAGFSITGTWPVRTEMTTRMVSAGANALASSIVLVCRKRDENATTVSRREFQRELNSAMNDALEQMTFGGENSPVAPVDLSQAIIGPGMSIFSKYKAVMKADGSAMNVQEALVQINKFMSDGDFDNETLFCKDWFLTHWWDESTYGEADVLARAKSADIIRLGNRGVIQSGRGKVRITNWRDYTDEMIKENYKPISAWLVLHLCIHELNEHGIAGAAKIYAKYRTTAASARSLAYVLYTLCERAGKAEDARYYNELIVAWESIETSAPSANGNSQISFLGDEIV